MGRVGDDHRGLGHLRHHALARAGLPQLADLRLDGRVALGLFELLLEFAQRHFLPLVPLPVLPQVIERRDHGEHRDHDAERAERERAREAERAGRVGVDEAVEPPALGPQQRRHDAADERGLAMPLAKLTSAWRENKRLSPAAGETFESAGRSGSVDQRKRCWIMLPATAAAISTRNGIAAAAMISLPSRATSRISAPPSNATACALAMRPRKAASSAAPRQPEQL